MTNSRYQPTYRADEISLILRFAERGESLGLMGVAGIGKSNIINFLRNLEQNAPQVGQDVAPIHFPVIDATQWQHTPNSLWTMMADALNGVIKDLSVPPPDNKIIPISEDERAFKLVEVRLKWLCQDLMHKVMFVLDDFDGVLAAGPLAMLERLNGLRSEGNREHLSYLVFTKRLPHVLGHAYGLEDGSKFYDLFRHHIYALAPYTEADAMQMLTHLNELQGNPLNQSQLAQIYQLTGGHARLLKIIFDLWAEEGASGPKVAFFTNEAAIRAECRRILIGLHEDEQAAALLAAQRRHTTEQQALLDHLQRRGLLVKIDPVTWFSPVIDQFLSTYQA
jgi:hypothetical protein